LTLSFIVTLGFALGRAPAQAPLVPPSQPFDASPITPFPVLISSSIAPLPPPSHPVLNKHGYCCGADKEWFGCGNAHTQFDFVFGSCRSFFGEPCAPTPPRSGLFRRNGDGANGQAPCASCGR
jgi:hypothetical protein